MSLGGMEFPLGEIFDEATRDEGWVDAHSIVHFGEFFDQPGVIDGHIERDSTGPRLAASIFVHELRASKTMIFAARIGDPRFGIRQGTQWCAVR